MATQKEIIEIEIKGIGEATKEVDKLSASVNSLDDNLGKVEDQGGKASESIDKVAGNGGAIAILDQLTGGLATRFKDAFEATKLFNFSLKGTRTALIATGIGAFVVALGLVVVFWDDIKDAINGANKELQKQLDDTIKLQKSTQLLIDLKDAEIALAEKQGKATQGLIDQKISLIRLQQSLNDRELNNLEIQAARLKASALELTTREKIIRAVANAARAGSGDALIFQGQLEAAEKFKELQDLIVNAKKEQLDLSLLLFNIENPDENQDGTKRNQIDELTIGEQLENDRTLAEGKLEIIKEFADKRLEVIQLADTEELKSSTDLSISKARVQAKERQQDIKQKRFKDRIRKDEIAQERILQNQKISIISQTLGAVADILGTNSKAGKAAAIAQATINTYQGITEVWSSESALLEPFATIARIGSTAVVLASGLSAVKQIKSQKLPALGGKGTANISSASAPSLPSTVQAATPSFSLAGTTGVNQLAESIGGQSQEPLRAFVVSSDVTAGQRLDDNIIQGASIG